VVFKFLIKKHLRDSYPSWLVLGTDVFVTWITLVTYWYTSQALTPSVTQFPDFYQNDYFTFLLVGEMTLLLPLTLFESPSRVLRGLILDQTLEHYLLAPQGPGYFMVLSSLACLPRQLIRMVLMGLFAIVFFHLEISLDRFFVALVQIVVAAPVMLGLGMMASSIILRTGRGNSFISYFTSISALFAGAYFPVTVFPEQLHKLLLIFSPFTQLLINVRRQVARGEVNWSSLLICLGVGALLLSCGRYAVSKSFLSLRKSGRLDEGHLERVREVTQVNTGVRRVPKIDG
jgi:ABC-type uncharacterized transport system permease subunit